MLEREPQRIWHRKPRKHLRLRRRRKRKQHPRLRRLQPRQPRSQQLQVPNPQRGQQHVSKIELPARAPYRLIFLREQRSSSRHELALLRSGLEPQLRPPQQPRKPQWHEAKAQPLLRLPKRQPLLGGKLPLVAIHLQRVEGYCGDVYRSLAVLWLAM